MVDGTRCSDLRPKIVKDLTFSGVAQKAIMGNYHAPFTDQPMPITQRVWTSHTMLSSSCHRQGFCAEQGLVISACIGPMLVMMDEAPNEDGYLVH